MIESANKAPWSGPGEGLEINVAYVIQHIIVMACYSSNDEQFVVMQKCRMSRSAFWNRTRHGWLSPVGSFEIEDDEVGQVRSVLVLATEDQKFIALVQGCGVTWTQSVSQLRRHR